jgi:hypothetical protein
MLVTSNIDALFHHSIVDELVKLGFPSEEDLLNNMISIYVFSQLSHSLLQVGA